MSTSQCLSEISIGLGAKTICCVELISYTARKPLDAKSDSAPARKDNIVWYSAGSVQ